MKKYLLALVAVAVLAVPASSAASSYHPDTIITDSYYGEGVQYVVWFTAGNINSPNYPIEFKCRVDNGDWYACGLNQATTGLPTYEYLTGLDPGRHTFRVSTQFRGADDNTPAKVVIQL